MSNAIVSNQVSVSVPVEAKPLDAGRFPGMLGSFQREFYNSLKACGVSAEVSHKVATDFGSDLGRAIREDSELASAVGKANKNNESTFKITGKTARVANSYAMELKRVCQFMDDMASQKLIKRGTLPPLKDSLIEYLADCGKWAAEQKWS